MISWKSGTRLLFEESNKLLPVIADITNLEEKVLGSVFSVNLGCKKELNLMLKVSETTSQGEVGFELKRH